MILTLGIGDGVLPLPCANCAACMAMRCCNVSVSIITPVEKHLSLSKILPLFRHFLQGIVEIGKTLQEMSIAL